jgi:hypothetical protein
MVHDIVVHQRCGMDHFCDLCQTVLPLADIMLSGSLGAGLWGQGTGVRWWGPRGPGLQESETTRRTIGEQGTWMLKTSKNGGVG